MGALDGVFPGVALIQDIDTFLLSQKQWIDLTAGEQHLTPYQINRILLSAIIVDPDKWTEDFYVRLQYTHNFIKSSFGVDRTVRSELLRQDSYPEVLLDQVHASMALYQGSHGLDVEVVNVDDNASPFIMLHMLETLDDYFAYMKGLGLESNPGLLDQAVMRHLFSDLSLQGKIDQLKKAIDNDNPLWLDTLLSFMPASEYDLADLHGELLCYALRRGNLNVAQSMLAKDTINVNFTSDHLAPALSVAARDGYMHIVRLLLSNVSIDVNSENPLRGSALICSLENGNRDIAMLLLKKTGISVNAKSFYSGDSALILAVKKGYVNIVNQLLSHDELDIYAKTRTSGNNALEVARIKKHTVIEGMLRRVYGLADRQRSRDLYGTFRFRGPQQSRRGQPTITTDVATQASEDKESRCVIC
ncbi:MAG: ankyrin repeat domain-containing protein [Coxiellaceae bacterium]|nr:ankyrin repeat domain-containing protein [Coxiellaceae bacterium]